MNRFDNKHAKDNSVKKLPVELLTVKAKETEEVEMFTYLGILVSINGNPEYKIATVYTGSAFDKLRSI